MVLVVLNDWLAAHAQVAHVEYVVTDPNGIARGKWAPAASLHKAFAPGPAGGINFPLSLHALDVWGTEVPETGLHISSGDRDGFFRAVPETLSLVPGRADVAQVLLQTFEPGGEPFGGCARQVLRAACERLAAAGLFPTCAFELEFHLFAPGEPGEPPVIADPPALGDSRRMYGLRALVEQSPVLGLVREAGATAGLPIDTIVKEAAPGQYEVNLTHRARGEGGALRAADDAVLLRRIVHASARAHGLRASFMAKPFRDEAGNGAHIHVSLADAEGRNVFAGEGGDARLRHAAGGLVSTMRETALVFCNTVNGFRRMAPGSYAPTRANWGFNNRSVAVRVPASGEAARRLEHRVSGADANPYLILATVLSAMAEGIERGVEPPPELEGNAYDTAAPGRGERLPLSMDEALSLFAASPFAARALGETMHRNLAHLKRAEIAGFLHDISPLERATYT